MFLFRRRVKSGKKGKAASECESTKDICNDTAIVQSEDDLSREGRVDDASTGQETPPSLRSSIEQASTILYAQAVETVPEIPDVENYRSEFESCLSLIGKCIFVQPIHAVKKSWKKILLR